MYGRHSILSEKSFQFAIAVIKVVQNLQRVHNEYVLSKQLLRSGTSIGALIRESEFAQSKADFINKLSISLKEANETEYWLLLLKESKYLAETELNEHFQKCKEIIAILVASLKTSKGIKKDEY